MIRAKFRCMSIARHAEQATEIRLLPVNPKGSCYPDGCEENRAFWDATPSGELKVYFQQTATVPFILGAFYYIDMEPSAKGEHLWKLWEVAQHEGNINIRLGLEWSKDREMAHAELSMCILNKETWPSFVNQAGTTWSVVFTQA